MSEPGNPSVDPSERSESGRPPKPPETSTSQGNWPPKPPGGSSSWGSPPPQSPRRGGIVWPLILILLGVSFLLNNLGIVSWNVWEVMWRLWPVWLIVAGLDLLIGRRTRWGSWVIVGLVLALLGAGAWFYNAFGTGPEGTADPVPINQPLGEAKRAEISINTSVSQLLLRDLPESQTLVEGTVQPLRGEQLVQSYRVTGNTARFDLSTKAERIGPFSFGNINYRGRWDLGLNPKVPTTLRVETGVGSAELNLAHLQITDLTLKTGVGEALVIMPQQGKVRARVDAGVGSLDIRVPKGMAVKSRVSTGIGNVEVMGERIRDGETYTSPGFDQAENRLEIEVNGGVGSITIAEGM